MAKETVKVDNGLEEVKLQSHDKMEQKKDKKEKKNKNAKPQKTAKKEETKKNTENSISSEMKLVTWPSKKNVIKYSLATIFMVVVLAAFFIGISALFDLLYSLVQGWIG